MYLDLRASARPKKSKILEYFDLKMFNLSEIFQNLNEAIKVFHFLVNFEKLELTKKRNGRTTSPKKYTPGFNNFRAIRKKCLY